VLALRAGRPGDAAQAVLDARAGTDPEGAVRLPAVSRLLLASVEARVALARGRLDEAAAVADEPIEAHPLVAPLTFVPDLLVARAAVRRAEGDAEAAVALLERAGAQAAEFGAASPATTGWRADLALALADAGRPAEARDAAEQEVAAARRLGAPRPLAHALRALARATGDRAVAAEALATAQDGAPELEQARCALAAGLLAAQAGDGAAAREHLRAAMDGAWHAGAPGDAERARAALVAAGGRPRRQALRGVEALTAAEARTARLAADGLTNRDIAEALFVTLGIVERQLTSAYRKLAIGGRAELRDALERGSEHERGG